MTTYVPSGYLDEGGAIYIYHDLDIFLISPSFRSKALSFDLFTSIQF